MVVFIIIAAWGFFSHLFILAGWWLVFSFFNRDTYESDEEYLISEQIDSSQNALSIWDTRLMSLSLMVLGLAGWVTWMPFGENYWKSFLIGIAAALLTEILAVAIFKIHSHIKRSHRNRQLAKISQSFTSSKL